jgi:hypothetical protein
MGILSEMAITEPTKEKFIPTPIEMNPDICQIEPTIISDEKLDNSRIKTF